MNAPHDLFSELRLGNLTLGNRIVMSPMTRCRAESDGTATALMAEYYTQRAGAGLIVTEATWISQLGNGYVASGGLANDKHVTGWKQVTDSVHRAGGHIFCQLVHAGRMTHESIAGATPIAPSAIPARATLHTPVGKVPAPEPRAMTATDIENVIGEFRRATERAVAAGFDGVELHGANGYLISEFLASNSNQRTDQYGGSIENRARFAIEVLSAMASVKGGSYVGVKLSPNSFAAHDVVEEQSAELNRYLATQLSKLQLAYIHVQRPIVNWGEAEAPYDVDRNVRDAFPGVVLVGSMLNSRAEAEALLASGVADGCVFGRAYLANPDLPERLRKDAELNAPDFATLYTPGEKGYTDYPRLATG